MVLRIEDFRQRTRRYPPKSVYDYIEAGSEDERCLRENEADFAALRLLPACLRDTTCIDTAEEVFG